MDSYEDTETMSSINTPPEMITEILYRLPAKSVARFRRVSKDWLSLLSSPKFIMTHQNTLNKKHFILDYAESSALYSLPFSNHLKEISRSPTKVRLKLPHASVYHIHGSCNGLILVSFRDFHTFPLPSVLNPTTRELCQIPRLDYETVYDLLGFGYDSLTDDYKVVRIHDCYYSHTFPHEINVYSLRTKTWSCLRNVSSNNNYYSRLIKSSLTPGIFVNGVLHWFVKKHSDDLPVIIAFGLGDNKLNEVSIPNLPNDVEIECDCQLVDIGRKLGIFLNTKGKGMIWLMNEYGVKESWTKILLHGFHRKHWKIFQPMIFYDKGKFLVIEYDQLFIYDIKGRRLSKTGEISFGTLNKIRGSYVESLVSPNQL